MTRQTEPVPVPAIGPPAPPRMRRIRPFRSLDAFRGLAAVWVVMYHSTFSLLGRTMEFQSSPLYAVSMRGQIGVVLFFVISGYCITAAAYGGLISGKSVTRYFYERMRRIFPPYLGAIVLMILSLQLIAIAERFHFIPIVRFAQALSSSPRFWVGNLLLLQYELHVPSFNSISWSLCYEVAFYFVIGLFLAGAKRLAKARGAGSGAYFLVAALGTSTVLSLAYMLVLQRPAPFPFDLWHQFSAGGILFFLLDVGPNTASFYTKGFRNVVWGNVCLTACLIALFAVFCNLDPNSDIVHPSGTLRAWICLAFCLSLSVLRRYDDAISTYRPLKPLFWLGAFSYSLYLAHTIIIGYVEILCRRLGLDGNLYWISLWAQVLIAIGFSRLFYVLIERRFISKRQVERLASEQGA